MPNIKISAMPGLGTNAAPGDLLTVVDVSAPAATANKKETLNNLLSTITRGITDKAVRFQSPGTAPAVSLAAEGAIYFDGANFQISANGGAYAPLLSLSPQADHAVLIGPLSGGPTAPTWRGLTLSDLPAIATDRLLGRVSPGSGDVEEITPGAGVLTWLTSPTVTNLSTALGVSTTGSNNWVFSDSPTLTTPRIAQINVNSTRAVLGFVQSGNSVNYLQITNSVAVGPFTTGGPTIESVGTSADVNFWVKSKGGGNIDLSAGTLGVVNIRSLDPNNCGVINIKDGALIGAQLVVGGLLFGAPLGGSGTYTLPAADGTSGQAITTDGFGILSWSSFVSDSIATNSFLGRTAGGTGPVQTLTAGAGVLSWLQTPTADNLRSAVTGDTGTGNLVFADAPTITSPTVSGGNLDFSANQQRITAVTNVGLSDRFAFQSRTASTGTVLTILPNGDGMTSGALFHTSSSDFTNFYQGQFLMVIGESYRLNSRGLGTFASTTLPIYLQTNDTTRIAIEKNGNIGFNGSSYGASSVGVIYIANASTVPTGNPTGGGVLYVTGGALKYRGSSGTVTDIAAA